MKRRQHREPLTPAEWKVMRIVWRKGNCAARDVYTEAGEQFDWSVSTVKTILRRLVEKNCLSTTQVGNSFLYRPVRSALSSLTRAADGLLENALEGTVGPLLAYMVKRSDLSEADLKELRTILNESESAPESPKEQGEKPS